MKKVIIAAVTAGLILVGTGTALAATNQSPAEIYAGLKGITVDQAYTERDTGKSFGQLAAEADVLDEFQEQMLKNRKSAIQERVTAGTLTQEEADALILRIEENAANCNGTGTGVGMGFGRSGQGSADRGTGMRGQGTGSWACGYATGR